MTTSGFDYEQIDAGVRLCVRRLREWGFETTDSGDGVSKPEDDRALDKPHVFMAVAPEHMVHEAKRLLTLVRMWFLGVPLGAEKGIRIEASYSPIDDTAILMLLGAHDALLAQELSA